MSNQQGDLVVVDTLDGGDLVIESGVAQMDGGLITAVYLSLFTEAGWWASGYAGETLAAIRGAPITSASRLNIQRAAERDLAWLLSEQVAESVAVEVSIAGRNRVEITAQIDSTTAGPWAVVWENSRQ